MYVTMNCRLTYSVFLLLLAGCAEQVTRQAVTVPVEERHVSIPVKSGTDASISKISQASSVSEPVILALISDAQEQASTGRTDKAAATIERAIKIEPGNPALWHELARIRLQQQRWQQAISLARKSNTLASNKPALQSSNWGIIAQAYEAMGDRKKAAEARKKQELSG